MDERVFKHNVHTPGVPTFSAVRDRFGAEFPLIAARVVSPRLEVYAACEYIKYNNAKYGCDLRGEQTGVSYDTSPPFYGPVSSDDEGWFARAAVCAHAAGVQLDLSSSDALFAQLNKWVAEQNCAGGFPDYDEETN